MGAKRNAPDPRPSARGRMEAALGPTTRRELAKNAHVCVLIQHAEYPSKTTTQLPGKTPSAGVRLLHPVRLKRKRTAFFRPACPLSRPRRRANSPDGPDVAQTQIDPARAPHLAAPERGRLTTQKNQVPHPLKNAGSDAQGAQARCALEYMGACGTRRIRFRNLRCAAQCHGRKSG